MRCSLWVTVSHLLNVIWSFSNVPQVDYQDILYKVEHHYYPFSKLFPLIIDHHHLKFILLCTTFSILLFMAFDRDLLCELICRLIAGYEKWLMLRIRDLFHILNSNSREHRTSSSSFYDLLNRKARHSRIVALFCSFQATNHSFWQWSMNKICLVQKLLFQLCIFWYPDEKKAQMRFEQQQDDWWLQQKYSFAACTRQILIF